ncbi:MAG: cyclic nucleotide-binding domain-containing protein, partial [Blastochloris sp.]|nr:cyclic nucleotide-binding domain-containing protein [Blastochloris sp.]
MKTIPLPALTEKTMLSVFPECRFRVFERGSLIFKQNSAAQTLYFIVSGRVQVLRVFKGKIELPLATLKKGELLGEMALLTGKKRSAQARAVTQVKTLEVTRRQLENLVLDNNPLATSMALHLALLLANRLGNVFSGLHGSARGGYFQSSGPQCGCEEGAA